MKSILKTFIPLSLVFAVLVSTNFLYAAWTAPAGVPSTGNNASSPIDTSAVDQVKVGGLSVGSLSIANNMFVQGGNTTKTITVWDPTARNFVGLFSGAFVQKTVPNTPSGAVDLEVAGKIGSGQFCDTTGTVCFSAAQARTAIDKAAAYTTYTKFGKRYYWGRSNGIFGSDSSKRPSDAYAYCNPGDTAIAGRSWTHADDNGRGFSLGNSYTTVIDGYTRMSPSYFDSKNLKWRIPSNSTHQRTWSYNGYDRSGSHGSYAGSEVTCIHFK